MHIFRSSGLPVNVDDLREFERKFTECAARINDRWANPDNAEFRDFVKSQRAYSMLEGYLRRKFNSGYSVVNLDDVKSLCLATGYSAKFSVDADGSLTLEILDREPTMYEGGIFG